MVSNKESGIKLKKSRIFYVGMGMQRHIAMHLRLRNGMLGIYSEADGNSSSLGQGIIPAFPHAETDFGVWREWRLVKF